ncbi:hypothetical protein BHYA_0739g00020 [Botrytis hyacinthi]|uniref:Uncharacterized protein n=1 Tax=Botrytis hyacinthi TaxID=278943 RepID=A0A4Z1GB89_9HELO|nr:hypothetical protein BHYA_0739g00020 [Botrytis hyacinthi]
MVDTAVKEFGRIDYYVHSAGVCSIPHRIRPSPPTLTPSPYPNSITSSTPTCAARSSANAPSQAPRSCKNRPPHQGHYTARSLGRGCIVNLGSANSVVAFPGKTAYTTAKHAVVGITKSGAVDHAPRGIRINAICPTWVAGPMNTHEAAPNPHFEHMVQAVVPLKRVAQPDEVADAIHFLCSPAATYITGATLIIDAGTRLTVRLV